MTNLQRKLLLLFATLIAAPCHALTMIPLDIEELSIRADSIFHGRAVSNEHIIDTVTGIPATLTSFEVIHSIKGSIGEMMIIKQIGIEGGDDRLKMRISGVPRFRVGDEYVLFMPSPSRHGFSSPIGMTQGRYTIIDEDGTSFVRAGDASKLQKQSNGALRIRLDKFIDDIESLIGERR